MMAVMTSCGGEMVDDDMTGWLVAAMLLLQINLYLHIISLTSLVILSGFCSAAIRCNADYPTVGAVISVKSW